MLKFNCKAFLLQLTLIFYYFQLNSLYIINNKLFYSRQLSIHSFSEKSITDLIRSTFEALPIKSNTEESNELIEVKSKPKKQTKVKAKVIKEDNLKEDTGYNFKDETGEYDVPILPEHRWYKVAVRLRGEKTMVETLLELKSQSKKWSDTIADAFYPLSPYVKFKGKVLEYATKPLTPGYIYIKTKMSPDIADEIESIYGIYGFIKSSKYNVVLPISEENSEQLEYYRSKPVDSLTPDQLKLRKEEYVTITKGPLKGRYGILMGAKNGKLEVCLRSEYKDDWDSFTLDQLEYLENPPEKKWKEMTPKEAVLSLMAKDKFNPTIKSLKKQGILDEILNPRPVITTLSKSGDSYERTGFTGGKRERSIAKEDKENVNKPWTKVISNDKWFDPFSDNEIKSNDKEITNEAVISDSAIKPWNKKPLTPSPKTNNNNNDNWSSNFDIDFDDNIPTNKPPITTTRPSRNINKVDYSLDNIWDDIMNDFDLDKVQGNRNSDADNQIFDSLMNDITNDVKKSNKKINKSTDPSIQFDILSDPINDLNDMISNDNKLVTSSTKQSNSNIDKNVGPSMEDYESFEEYLDALVQHEKNNKIDSKLNKAVISKSNDKLDTTAISKANKKSNDLLLDDFNIDDFLSDVLSDSSITNSLLEDEFSSNNNLVDRALDNKSDDYSTKTVRELKELLKSRGMPVSGVKSELIARLNSN